MQLRLLATSDVHMHLSGWDDRLGVENPAMGLARLAHLIDVMRKSSEGPVLLLDNGDSFQGTPLATSAAAAPVKSHHPWIAACNLMRYDAIGLGNHDFDFGLDYLRAVADLLDAPMLCSNLNRALHPIRHAQIIDVPTPDGKPVLKIGLLSFAPVETAIWAKRQLDGQIGFLDPRNALSQRAKTLRTEGVDLIVALAHSGLDDGKDSEIGELFASDLAATGQVDAMIAGHTHRHFPGPDHAAARQIDPLAGTVFGVPTVMPGYAGAALGVIDLDLSREERWRITRHRPRLLPSDHAPERSEILEVSRRARRATMRKMSRAVGETACHINSFFSLLRPDTSAALMAEAFRDAAGEAVANSAHANLPLLVSVSPKASGGRSGPDNYVNIPPGPVTERHIAMACPFPNTVSIVPMTGAILRDWIERSLALFPQVPDDGVTRALQDSSMPSFHFEMVWGLDLTADLRASPRFTVDGQPLEGRMGRIKKLHWNGTAVQPHQRFLVAMTSYRAAGGGRFPGLTEQSGHIQTRVSLQDALRQLLFRSKPWRPGVRLNWRIEAGGRDWLFDTSPAAKVHLDEIPSLNPESLGLTDKGFLRIKLRL
ncbi:MAG: bifunctional metallophosphatase/5'-nucleotidase [Paracoccaceae bacterium]